MNKVTIELTGVSKKYQLYESPSDRLREALNPFGKSYHRDFSALEDISLRVREREIIGIVGNNGCGKSTLLKLIANVLKPTEGTVSVHGTVTPLLELGAGLNPEYSGMENIFFYGNVLGLSRALIEELIEDILEFADIGEHIDQPLRTYSSGMKSRLGFAIAAHVDPEILIVDEVLAVGDVAFQRKCYRKMEELFGGGTTVLYVSHNMQSVVQLCDRAIMLEKGRLLLDDEPDRVVKEYQKLLFQKKQPNTELKDSTKVSSVVQEDAEVGYHPELYLDGLYTNPVEVNPEIAKFSSIKLIASDGYWVNQLNQGEEYTISFYCEFFVEVGSISFGCQLQTIEGITISGANMRDNQDQNYLLAKPGESVHVQCRFSCHLVPGPYVVKVFSAPEDGTPPSVLEDAMLFQVKQGSRRNGGYVFLGQHITAEMKKHPKVI